MLPLITVAQVVVGAGVAEFDDTLTLHTNGLLPTEPDPVTCWDQQVHDEVHYIILLMPRFFSISSSFWTSSTFLAKA